MNAHASTRGPSAAHDFDFLVGTWNTRQRRLKKRLRGNDEWETFEATSTVQRLPGGVANFDTLVAEGWRPGWVGMSFRVFNPSTALWSIYWVTNEGGGIDPASGRLEQPVVGRFEGDEGLFEGDDQFEGHPIRVRFRWTRRGPDAARWEQAFSADAGGSWEVNWVMEFERKTTSPPAPIQAPPELDHGCNVVELRQYTLHAGQRDVLIDLFEREFVETQEAAGIAVMGQFRDLDAPDRFVWLRGFPSMDRRGASLAAFYDGPVWHQHRNAANATMIDSDDVLLLRPAWPGSGIGWRGRERATGAVRTSLPGLLDASIFRLREPASPELLRFCRETMTQVLIRGGADVLGWYVTEDAPNNFPRLPVRQGEHVLVGFAMFETPAAFEAFVGSGRWACDVQPALEPWVADTTKSLRLVATARSAIHG
jgi:NIPSNAP